MASYNLLEFGAFHIRTYKCVFVAIACHGRLSDFVLIQINSDHMAEVGEHIEPLHRQLSPCTTEIKA
ncbi:hypothetical protein D3C78_1138410 [compost metagenome]